MTGINQADEETYLQTSMLTVATMNCEKLAKSVISVALKGALLKPA